MVEKSILKIHTQNENIQFIGDNNSKHNRPTAMWVSFDFVAHRDNTQTYTK